VPRPSLALNRLGFLGLRVEGSELRVEGLV
jgi:hypothetical protein